MINIGTEVVVKSGPHQGRAGIVTQVRDVSINDREPEPYAIVQYSERNCFDEVNVDHISVPVRRLETRR